MAFLPSSSGPLGASKGMLYGPSRNVSSQQGWGPVSSSGVLSNPLLTMQRPQQSAQPASQPQWGSPSGGQLGNPQLARPSQQSGGASAWNAMPGMPGSAGMPNMANYGGQMQSMQQMQRPQMGGMQPSMQQMNQGPLGMGGQSYGNQSYGQYQPMNQQAQYGRNAPGAQKLSGNIRMAGY